MEFTNLEIAKLLRSVSAAYQIKDPEGARFKIIAYDRAATAVEHLSSEIKDLYDEGKLDEIPGIGKSIASHLSELFEKGWSSHFEEVMKGIPKQVFALMDLPGIGPKTAIKLVEKLGLQEEENPILALEKAAREGRIAKIEGFGEESQSDILQAIAQSKTQKRMLLSYASGIAERVVEWLRGEAAVLKVDVLGSLRRQVSTIGDIDIAVASEKPSLVIERFISFPQVKRVIERGEKTSSILLPSNVQVDLMVTSLSYYGSLLQHFTGSKHHNIALREFALKKGYSLSEYGIKKRGKGRIKRFTDEESFYNFLGLDYIPPELREDTGEIEAALEHKIPILVELSDVKGDLQIHSNFDTETSHDLGESSMEELVIRASELGYEYIALTDHNPSKSRHSKKEIIEIVKRRSERIAVLNNNLIRIKEEQLNYSNKEARYAGVKKVFNSLEIDILPNGELSLPEEALQLLDFALISIHSSFRQPKEIVTKRILDALSFPKVKILAHPTARKINSREGVDADWMKVFEFCLANNKWIEINADPMRLDLPDFLVKDAKKVGIKFALGTDSHHIAGLNNMRWGISVARRGWLEAKDIVNTLSLSDFESALNF